MIKNRRSKNASAGFGEDKRKREANVKAALQYHIGGKISMIPTKPLNNARDLSLAYSPYVAEPCKLISKKPNAVFEYTAKGNTVAVITNGTAVLGLGNLGPAAAKPVMEGKSGLLNRFGGLSSFDIEVNTTDVDGFVFTVANIAETVGGINLEDIASPECFEIERRLSELVDVPVFHDDQHGTAIIMCAGLINACDITGKNIKDIHVVVNGCGAAGVACIEMMKELGVRHLVVCDQNGVIYKGRSLGLNSIKSRYAIDTKLRSLEDAMCNADVFVGVSVKDVVSTSMLQSMAKKPIIFAMANPDPEIHPELARKVRPDAIIATGRSDYENQINNVMCFPYIFRGALDVRAKKINQQMKIAAVHALSKLAREPVISEVRRAYNRHMEYGPNYIIPTPFDPRLFFEVSNAVGQAAIASGEIREKITPDELTKKINARRIKLQDNHVISVANSLNVSSNKIKEDNKTIIFAEGEEKKAILSSINWCNEDYGNAILVGNEQKIRAMFEELQISSSYLNHGKISVMNSANCSTTGQYIDNMYSRLNRKGYLYRSCVREVKIDRNIFSASALVAGHADLMVVGLTRNYLPVLYQILPLLEEGKSEKQLLFSITMLITGNKTIFVADTTINTTLNAQEIMEIAIRTAYKVQNLGFVPRVAFISHSNFGSDNSRNNCMREAVKLMSSPQAQTLMEKLGVKDLSYDGEMTIDVALNKDSFSKYPFMNLKEEANILIMPNIDASTALCHFTKRTNNATVVGPIIRGLPYPLQIVDNTFSEDDIVNLSLVSIDHD
ncbi:MAG: NADP-dependent malic enzyme [Candidatus Xenolissoclinum pacificiensis L6]|uniref:NADP-dependent malic enzyme n=1 Tax=Candidatus Xenolissoclinum pacificiensis L6 TaxID=1401685 RepID=W2V1E8_9RICK|nr:MAG: NADP-dependent malic enzyme [Candidatus Xenolissoclinum pacificiensis L6]